MTVQIMYWLGSNLFGILWGVMNGWGLKKSRNVFFIKNILDKVKSCIKTLMQDHIDCMQLEIDLAPRL